MIIVLGSSGFIGKALIDYFLQNKIYCVGLSSKEIDLTADSSVQKLKKYFKPENILIFASSVVREKGDTFENMQKNIDMAKNVALAFLNFPIKKVIYLSSIDVYGKPEDVITENTVINPQNPYGISKVTSELILRNSGIPLLVLRLGGIFGFGQSANKYGPNAFINSAFKNSSVTIFGDGKELRDLVFVDDLVRIISYLSFSRTTGVINIASGRPASFIEIVQMIKKLFLGKIQVIKKPRSGQKVDFVFDNSLLIKNLKKSFRFTAMKEALKITVDSYKKSDYTT